MGVSGPVSLLRRPGRADDQVAEVERTVRARALLEGKGEHIGHPVDPAVVAVVLPDPLLVHKGHADLVCRAFQLCDDPGNESGHLIGYHRVRRLQITDRDFDHGSTFPPAVMPRDSVAASPLRPLIG